MRPYINLLICSVQQTKVQHQQLHLYTQVVNQLLANRLVVVDSAQSVTACFRDQAIFLTYDQLIIQPLDPRYGNHESERLGLVRFVGAYIIFKDNARASRERSDFYQSTTSLYRRHGNIRVWLCGSCRV